MRHSDASPLRVLGAVGAATPLDSLPVNSASDVSFAAGVVLGDVPVSAGDLRRHAVRSYWGARCAAAAPPR